MSTVWLAQRPDAPFNYVVKEASDRFIPMDKVERRLKMEARILSMFTDCPNIVRYFEHFYAGGRFYISMEYIEGHSLRRVSKKVKGLGERVCWAWLAQLLNAAKVMHDRNVIHRDINPDNIMLRGHDLVLIDFGVARILEKPVERGTSIRHGPYSAPEQAAKQNAIAHRAADFYSIGATAYSMYMGRPALEFMGEEVRSELKDKGASNRLTDLICKSTNFDPTQRWKTIDEMIKILPDLPRRSSQPGPANRTP